MAARYPNADPWIGPAFASGACGTALGAVLSGVLIPRLGGPLRTCLLCVPLGIGLFPVWLWVTPHPAFTALLPIGTALPFVLYITASLSLPYRFSGREQSAAMFLDAGARQMTSVAAIAVGGLAVAATDTFMGWQVCLMVMVGVAAIPLMFIVRATRRQNALAAGG